MTCPCYGGSVAGPKLAKFDAAGAMEVTEWVPSVEQGKGVLREEGARASRPPTEEGSQQEPMGYELRTLYTEIHAC